MPADAQRKLDELNRQELGQTAPRTRPRLQAPAPRINLLADPAAMSSNSMALFGATGGSGSNSDEDEDETYYDMTTKRPDMGEEHLLMQLQQVQR